MIQRYFCSKKSMGEMSLAAINIKDGSINAVAAIQL